MIGVVSQRPPAYSAIKVGGRRAYAMARAGETVVLAERQVTLHELVLIDWDDTDPERPIAIVDVTCSAGTYVRAIARDLGEALGGAAYLGALIADWRPGRSSWRRRVPLDDIRAAAADGPEGLSAILRPIDDGPRRLPEHRADRDRNWRPSPAASTSDRSPGSRRRPSTTAFEAPTARWRRSRRPTARVWRLTRSS